MTAARALGAATLWRVLAIGLMASLVGWARAADTSAQTAQTAMRAVDLARLKARTVCSCLFVQQMSMNQCADGRSAIWRYPFNTIPPVLLESDKQRLVSVLQPSGASVQFLDGGQPIAQAVFLNDGGGCVSIEPGTESSLAGSPVRDDTTTPLPRAPLPRSADAAAVQKALDEGFSADGPFSGYARAALVVVDGNVVAERYAPGFGPQNRYYLGSVAKVFNNLLAGLLVRDGKLRVQDAVALPEWQSADKDPRRKITFDQMLHMTSGLDWNEDFFTPGAPSYEIYFGGSASFDVAHFVGTRPLEAKPGVHFEYSTGAATLLASALQSRLGEHGRAPLLSYFSRELFVPLGANGITPEFDAAGTFLAGHSVYARPDDLGRIGLLLLDEGRWQGRQLLPRGWVEYSTKPAERGEPAKSGYGAQMMIDMLKVPGCFGLSGVGGQELVVCPRRGLVLVWFSSAFDFFRQKNGEPEDTERRLVMAFPER